MVEEWECSSKSVSLEMVITESVRLMKTWSETNILDTRLPIAEKHPTVDTIMPSQCVCIQVWMIQLSMEGIMSRKAETMCRNIIEKEVAVNIWPAKYGPLMKVAGSFENVYHRISDANERLMLRHDNSYWSVPHQAVQRQKVIYKRYEDF